MSALQQDVKQLVAGYFTWLKDETHVSIADGDEECVVISTPHLDRHNDFLDILVERRDGGYELSDDGYVLADLKASGCPIDTPKRRKLFEEILRGFGVQIEHGVLRTTANKENFSSRKHSLLQAMLAVNDMFFTATPQVKSFFLDEVRAWMKENNIPFIEGANFIGRSGFRHRFEFAIPAFQDRPERYVQTINNPDRQAALNIITAWEDTQLARPAGASAYVFLNDRVSETIQDTVLDALSEYGITPVIWSARQEMVDELGFDKII